MAGVDIDGNRVKLVIGYVLGARPGCNALGANAHRLYQCWTALASSPQRRGAVSLRMTKPWPLHEAGDGDGHRPSGVTSHGDVTWGRPASLFPFPLSVVHGI
eukprot:scaffold4868_cov416-Prasinococcus_capsulatus_cf.AAC.37